MNTVDTPHKNIGGLARVAFLTIVILAIPIMFVLFSSVIVIIQGLVLLLVLFWTRFDCT